MPTLLDTYTEAAPAYWASYLINGDASSLDDDEIADADSFVADNGGHSPQDCGEEYLGTYNGLLCDLVDYTFPIYGDD